jgi:hypothetical protein
MPFQMDFQIASKPLNKGVFSVSSARPRLFVNQPRTIGVEFRQPF